MLAQSAIIQKTGNPLSVVQAYNVKLEPLSDDKVLVEMLISSINPADKMRILGVYPASKETFDFTTNKGTDDQYSKTNGVIVGGEGVGKVVQIGKNVTRCMNSTINIGDWVIPMSTDVYGTWSTHFVSSPNNLIVIKDKTNITPEHLSSVKVNASTAYRMLKDLVPLNKGDYIIQNGANSGAGQYVIQLARIWGYRTINVIRDRENYKELADHLIDLGADIVIKDTELTSNKVEKLLSSLDSPIKLAICCVTGKPGSLLAKYLCSGGVHVTYGDMTMESLSVRSTDMIFRNISFKGFWLVNFYKHTPVKLWMETWNDILDMMRQGKLRKQNVEFINWYSLSNGSQSLKSIPDLQKTLNLAISSPKKVAFIYRSKI
ncbi:hypothetical protein BB561_000342 [Smittium simulii]|uniref:enoyl-[acyl-carrier-protein] reductase n=1 Tax=Smittium simulii TaxID=133385 RepID=A0A2T9YZJ3_9FUNG|nr:hypothetical protein BB561_000342 [Smittium simulii]